MTENIETLLKESRLYRPSARTTADAYIKDYETEYKKSIADPEAFWSRMAKELHWFSPWNKVLEWNYPWAKWFVGATCNIAYNCLDRHVASPRKNKAALIWVGENDQERVFTYAELYRQVNRCANALKKLGLNAGDRVTIYLPKIPEQVIAMLACARIGVIHSVVYSGFSAPALASRINDAESRLVITADVGFDRSKILNLKPIVDDALKQCPTVEHVVVVRRQSSSPPPVPPNEIDWTEWLKNEKAVCAAEPLDSETPLYILYTSGTTGKPKGVVHVHGGYMVGTAYHLRTFYDLKEDDVFWCTSDIGWVVGHSYIVYAPLVEGITTVVREGAIDFPDPGIAWRVVEKHRVNVIFTAPTALRMFMKFGGEIPAKSDLSSLRLIAVAGEPLNPEACRWAFEHLVDGGKRGFIADNWWQTELGGPALGTPLCIP